MIKQPKYDVKVQKQTVAKTVKFRPQVQYRVRGQRESQGGGYIDSFRKIIQGRLFSKSKGKQLSPKKTNKIGIKTQNTQVTDFDESEKAVTQQQYISQTLQSSSSSLYSSKYQLSQQRFSRQRAISLSYELQQQQFSTTHYVKIKHIKKLSQDCVLIGNENQLDLIQFKVQKKHPLQKKKWTLHLNKPIQGVTVSRLAQSKILLWTDKELHIFECNLKAINIPPKLIEKITIEQENILSVQFVKRNIFLVCCHSHIQIYQIMEANMDVSIKKLDVKRFNCPKQYQVIEVPDHFGSNIKIFYANMAEHDDNNQTTFPRQRSRQKQSSSSSQAPSSTKAPNIKKDVFGLYYIQIQYDYSKTIIHEIKKVYEIKTSLRYELKLFNISSSIFFMNLKTQVLAVKNGMIIDSVGVNFKFDHCYLSIISADVLVYILTDKIEFYRLELNYDVMPERIKITSFDSIYFPRQLDDQFLSIVPVGNGYGFFFQHQLKKNQQFKQLKGGQINYWYVLTYPIPLHEKLDEIFPSIEEIQSTSFEAIQILCDMAGKMGLTISEAYRQLWKRSKKQTEKDYQILLSSKDYKIIQEQIITLLKKRGQKWRMINKNQQICLQFLKPRVFDSLTKLEALQEFTYCHFFNLKLTAYKDIQVERRRFQLQIYNKKLKLARQSVINKFRGMFEVKQIKEEYKQENIQSKKHVRFIRQQQQQSQILSQDFDFLSSKDQLQSQNQQQQQPNPIQILPLHEDKPRPNLFKTFLKTSKDYQQIQQDRKNIQVREKQKMNHELEQKLLQTNYNQIKIYIRDYYFYRDTSLKQYFLQTVAQLMSKQHTPNDHLKYYTLRVLVRNFKVLFRSIYEEIMLQLISTYRYKISRFIQHFIQLLPYEYNDNKLPQNTTDQSLCTCIWDPIKSQELEQCMFLSDITTIENKLVVNKFKQSLWYKRGYLTHHGVVSFTKQEIREKYSPENMKDIHQHYFYLFISKFLEIKSSLNKQIQQILSISKNSTPRTKSNQNKPLSTKDILQGIIELANEQKIDKRRQQSITRINKEIARTNQLLTRLQQIYPLMPQHLKGYINLYFDLYSYLEAFHIQEKQYNSVYEFLMLKHFELFQIYFMIQKKSKGFLLKNILQIYEDDSLVQDGRKKFISGLQDYFDSPKSQITDLKTILNRLNGQSIQFHIQFQSLYDCLLSAMMKKIKIRPSEEIKLDELLIYVQNIPFSSSNGKIFQKLLFIQQVHLEMDLLKRSKINMSIMEIRDNPQIVIGALVEAELRANKLILDNGAREYTADMGSYLQESNNQKKQQLNTDHNHSSLSLPTMKNEHTQITSHLPATGLITQGSVQTVAEFISSVSKLTLTKIQSLSQLKMYFWKCLSGLECTKRHLYGNQFQLLLGFIFITQLLQQEQLIPLIGQALQDEDIKQILQLNNFDDQRLLRKSIVYYSYNQRLSTHNKNYLASQSYLTSLLTYLPCSDQQRLLIEQQIRYCQLFKQCDYEIPYPLSVIGQIPALDEIEYHISRIRSQKIDQLDAEKLFASIENMRELIQPSVNLTHMSLSYRVKQFQCVLYEFVFFKYLRERKLLLALQLINKLILLYPKQNASIYCLFIIDAMLELFSDSTGDLLIKLVSYYFDDAQALRTLLCELISRSFTTVEFEKHLKEKIQTKINSKNYLYFGHNNDILSQEVKQFVSKIYSPQGRCNDQLKQLQFLHLCQLFDAVYYHVSKSSEYIQRNKYFQLLYRLMLFSPFQMAYFIYNKPQINLKAIRSFFSFMSQEFLFDSKLVLKVGSILFVIILNRIRGNFMIHQQIKQYKKLNLTSQTFDQSQFIARFSDLSTLTKVESLVYESYLAMKKKLECFQENFIQEKILRQLCRVKQVYDKNNFLVSKNNIIATRKYGNNYYLPYRKWLDCESHLEYYLNNIEEFSAYKAYTYQYTTVDKDESYITKGEDEFNCPKVTSWHNHVQFNKIKSRHEIMVLKKNTRIPSHQKFNSTVNDMVNFGLDAKRERKPSSYLPEEFKIQKQSTADMNRQSNFSQNSSNHVRHMQNSFAQRDSGNVLQLQAKCEFEKKVQLNYSPPIQNNGDNPLVNFLKVAKGFKGFGQFAKIQ